MATRRHFTKEFKLEAIRLLEHSGKSGTELARQLGVRRNQLYKWQSELRGRAERAFPGRGPHPESADELTRLKRELESVKQERDILKKAVVFFAKESS
jgi:transposase